MDLEFEEAIATSQAELENRQAEFQRRDDRRRDYLASTRANEPLHLQQLGESVQTNPSDKDGNCIIRAICS